MLHATNKLKLTILITIHILYSLNIILMIIVSWYQGGVLSNRPQHDEAKIWHINLTRSRRKVKCAAQVAQTIARKLRKPHNHIVFSSRCSFKLSSYFSDADDADNADFFLIYLRNPRHAAEKWVWHLNERAVEIACFFVLSIMGNKK